LSLIRGVACGAFANIDQLGVAATVIENRTDVWLNRVLTEHHIYSAANQVVGWTYDAAGKLLDDGATQSTYDPMDWLMMPTSGGQTRSYIYDADGTLATQTTGGQHRRVHNRGHGGGELRSFSEHPPRRHIIHKTKAPNGGPALAFRNGPYPTYQDAVQFAGFIASKAGQQQGRAFAMNRFSALAYP
jgi:hypothetical protein